MEQPNLPPNSPVPLSNPTPELLRELYARLPMLVVQLSSDGIVLHCNPEVSRATGYPEPDLVGRNFWSLLFPGRLFAQVPKFISLMQPIQAVATDVPMTLRMRDGRERIIAWSRFFHGNTSAGDPNTSEPRTIVCIGKDLTDRLLDADNAAQPNPVNLHGSIHFGPPIANLGTVDGDIIMPLAISPPAPALGENGGAAVQQVHEFLTEIHVRVEAMESAFSRGEMDSVAAIAAGLHTGAHACGLLDFSSRAERLRHAAAGGALESAATLVHEIVSLCRPDETRKKLP